MQLTVDAFNLFNFQGVVARDQRYTQASVQPIQGGTAKDLGALTYEDGTPFDPADKNPNYGNPSMYQAPRTVRLGAKVTF